jgi:hypothetical protein
MLLRSGYFVLRLQGDGHITDRVNDRVTDRVTDGVTDHEADDTGTPRSIGETRAPREKRGASMRRLIARIAATLAGLALAVGIAATSGHAMRPADGSSWSLAGSSWSYSVVQQPDVWGLADRQ